MNNSEFIANASHELRLPLTVLKGFAETLQNHPDMPQEMIQNVAEKMVFASARLEKLLQSLLWLADAENADAAFLSVQLFPLLLTCKELALTTHPEAQITVVCDNKEIAALGESTLLELAVLNLLENGIKYSPKPAVIQVSLSQTDQDVVMAIQDHGMGIEPKNLPHIFDRFYAVDKGRSKKMGGVGLGLAIVKSIVERHGGKISVSSELGKGSLFQILLKN